VKNPARKNHKLPVLASVIVLRWSDGCAVTFANGEKVRRRMAFAGAQQQEEQTITGRMSDLRCGFTEILRSVVIASQISLHAQRVNQTNLQGSTLSIQHSWR